MKVFFAQHISDFKKTTILLNDDVAGEGDAHRPHLVPEAQCSPLILLCVTADGVNRGQLRPVSPPFVNPEPLLFLS